MIRKINYFLPLILILYFTLAMSFILDNPPVWPDEAYFADTALNLLNQNRLGTDIWGDMIPGVARNLYFYPPGLFLTFAGLFSITGPSIYFQRLLAVMAGAGFLISFYFLGRKVINFKTKKSTETTFIYLTVLLLIVDHLFLKAARFSRPEIFVLFFSCLSITCLFIAEDSKAKWKNYLFSFAGLMLSISVLFHLMSVIYILAISLYWLYKYQLKVFSRVQTYYFFIPLILIVGLWLMIIFPNINFLFTQVALQKLYREVSPSYLSIIFTNAPLYIKIYYWIMLIIMPVSLIYSLVKNNSRLLLVSLVLLFSWVYAYIGKIEFYPVLLVPFSYLMSVVLLKLFNLKLLGVFFCALLVSLFVINLYIYQDSLKSFGSYRTYQVFNNNLKDKIPSDSNIYLSSIPDAYFIVKQYSNSRVYTYPALPTPKEEYLKVLNDSDYLIYNFNPEVIFFGNYLNEYLTLNVKEVTPVGMGDEYQVLIIKLVDKQLRKGP